MTIIKVGRLQKKKLLPGDFCFKELMRNSEVRKGFLSAVLELSPEEIEETELPKLKKYTHPETKLLDWMRFLNADQEEEMEEMAGKNQYIQTAYDDLKMLSADEQKRLAYEERLKAERDYVSFAYDNWERGMRRGVETGRKKGELEKTIRLARKKRTKGLTAEETAELLEEDAALIQKIYGCMETHPEWEDEKIAESMLADSVKTSPETENLLGNRN